jgi:hypothetical protein
MRDLGTFEGECLSRSKGYLEQTAPGDGFASVLSALAMTAFMLSAVIWLGVLA